jgi:hypothetical protein
MNVFNRKNCMFPETKPETMGLNVISYTGMVTPRRLCRSQIPHSDAKGADMLDAEYKSWRILLLCTIRQFRGAQRNINYEEALTADDNTDMYLLMLNDRCEILPASS